MDEQTAAAMEAAARYFGRVAESRRMMGINACALEEAELLE